MLSKSQDFKTKDSEVHKKTYALITGTITVQTRTETEQSVMAIHHGSVGNETAY